MDRFFNGCWYQVVRLFQKELRRFLEFSLDCSRESFQGAVFCHPVFALLNVDACWVVDRTVVLDNSRDLGAVLFKELRSPVSDCAETLNVECAIFDPFRQTNFVTETLIACQLFNSVVDTKAS